MTLTGTRFGTLEYSEEDIFELHSGLIGFESLRTFVVVNARPDSPFRWLQSVENPELAFLVTNPNEFLADYAPEIPDRTAKELDINAVTHCVVWTTASIPPGKPTDLTLNLVGPIIVNPDLRQGRQIVQDNEAYTTRYRVFASERDAKVAAA